MEDVIDAGKKLGLNVPVFGSDDQGLIALPKPLVAFVEHDHFIAVTKADKHGVTYLCSDCGAWPGGQVTLTWKQWHMLNASAYAAVTKPGCMLDGVLKQVLAPKAALPGIKVATAGSLEGLDLPRLTQSAMLLMLLKGHLIQDYLTNGGTNICGSKPQSQQCPPYIICC